LNSQVKSHAMMQLSQMQDFIYVHYFYHREVFFFPIPCGRFPICEFCGRVAIPDGGEGPPSSLLSRFCPSIFCPHSRIPSHTPGETLLYIDCIYIRVQNHTKLMYSGRKTSMIYFQFFASTLYLCVAQSLELKI
jgi:hypothetical protein